MHDESDNAELVQLRRERDLYLRLLRLGHEQEPGPFMNEALALLVELTNASQGYLELSDPEGPDERPRWWTAHGITGDELNQVRQAISRGIIAEAIATGRTVMTPSAVEDPRFSSRESVRTLRIEAVLCAPIGLGPPRGALYLRRGLASGGFTDEDRGRVELLAHHLTPLADRLLLRQRVQESSDPTRPWREKLRCEAVMGRSAALAAVLKQAALVAPLDVAVLLTGSSGTGKTQLAKVIHENSRRAAQRLVEVNCAAFPRDTVEDELFGHEKGAFTGAVSERQGKFEFADGGTLFLDEIGDMTLETQGKILRALQEKEFERVGGNRTIKVDVRVIAATNRDLEAKVRDGTFREDLYYRLNVVPIRMPSLAERPEDIPELAQFFCARVSEQHRLPRLNLSPNAMRAVQTAEWPGNARQLAHAIEAAVILAAGDGTARVEASHIFPARGAAARTEPEAQTFQEATRQFHRELLQRMLDDTEWNVAETARRLDLTRTHVYNLIRSFGLERR